MPFASALSTKGNTEQAIREVCSLAKEKMPAAPDLATLFYSAHHAGEADVLSRVMQETLSPCAVLGCPGEAIVGNDREIERGPAVSLWLAKWQQPVQIEPFHLTVEETSEGYSLLGWPDGLAAADPDRDMILLLGDPFTFPADGFLTQVNEQHPGLRVMGGMASGGREPGLNRHAAGIDRRRPGRRRRAAARADPACARWSRKAAGPSAGRWSSPRRSDNIITELGGKPPLVQLQEIWRAVAQHDQRVVQQGLHVGRVINEYQDDFQRGDFLVRNVMGMDRNTGAIAITDRVRVGQTVQFHVRDADTADEDLQQPAAARPGAPARRRRGAALHLQRPRHAALRRAAPRRRGDSRSTRRHPPRRLLRHGRDSAPSAAQNFIHGFTASIALFEE